MLGAVDAPKKPSRHGILFRETAATGRLPLPRWRALGAYIPRPRAPKPNFVLAPPQAGRGRLTASLLLCRTGGCWGVAHASFPPARLPVWSPGCRARDRCAHAYPPSRMPGAPAACARERALSTCVRVMPTKRRIRAEKVTSDHGCRPRGGQAAQPRWQMHSNMRRRDEEGAGQPRPRQRLAGPLPMPGAARRSSARHGGAGRPPPRQPGFAPSRPGPSEGTRSRRSCPCR